MVRESLKRAAKPHLDEFLAVWKPDAEAGSGKK
jgi:hypothetical protein